MARIPLLTSVIFLVLVSCEPAEQVSPLPGTSIETPDSVPAVQTDSMPLPAIRFDPIYDQVASYLCGLPVLSGSLDKKLTTAAEWKSYAQRSSSRWKQYDSTRVIPQISWRNRELKELNTRCEKLFYPFSGPDILNANVFFPDAKEYILVGLEPVGTVPFIGRDTIDTLANYFRSVETSLFSILKFSFFRTIAMKSDLHKDQVNGTIPLLMIFLKSRKNEIISINKMSIDATGKLSEKGRIPGVEIRFRKDSLHPVQTMYYFSTDLSNGGLLENWKEFKLFLDGMGRVNTYLKSASYLMHNAFFSTIRETILRQSEYILQDDSGIPYYYFDAKSWDIHLYGKYKGTIPLFSEEYQQDYQDAFVADSVAGKLSPLPFGIGYKWKGGESNLLLASRKANSTLVIPAQIKKDPKEKGQKSKVPGE
ncbi:MAG: hypothetical protein IT233_10125 [Bacteroidia bacterium]|nr:hypothetical protein [Bacteroidia bacterium]